jgi:membrane protein required for beta-lactamase induction
LVGELESSLRHIGHWLQRIERTTRTKRLSRRHHPHVDILLMRSLNLLLLLLQQLNLLLNGKLLH